MNPNSHGCEGFNHCVESGRWEDAVSIVEFNFSASNVRGSGSNRIGQKDEAGNPRSHDLVSDTSAENALDDGELYRRSREVER